MKILVILASYNGEKYKKEQVASILSQVGVDVNIKIFDAFLQQTIRQVTGKRVVKTKHIYKK